MSARTETRHTIRDIFMFFGVNRPNRCDSAVFIVAVVLISCRLTNFYFHSNGRFRRVCFPGVRKILVRDERTDRGRNGTRHSAPGDRRTAPRWILEEHLFGPGKKPSLQNFIFCFFIGFFFFFPKTHLHDVECVRARAGVSLNNFRTTLSKKIIKQKPTYFAPRVSNTIVGGKSGGKDV